MDNYVFRSLGTAQLEGRKLYGTVIPYNSLSHDLGGFRERFTPGSVTDTIKSGMIEAWYLHDQTKPLGSQAAGTLRLWEDTQGLHYENDVPDTSYARDMIALMSGDRKDVRGTSFGFRPIGTDGQRWLRNGSENIREIVKAEVNHISPVVTPAYPATFTGIRSVNGVEDECEAYGIDLRELRKVLLAADKGLTVTSDEMEIARKAISLLRSVVKTPRLEAAVNHASGVLL